MYRQLAVHYKRISMVVEVTGKPGSKKGPLIEEGADGLVIYVREKATDGKANEAVLKLLAEHFGVNKSSVLLKSGRSSRKKKFDIAV